MKRWFVIAAVLSLSACARKALENATPRGMESGLALRELPRRGEARTLTSADGDLTSVTRSADGRTIDIDSDLELVPLPSVIRESGSSEVSSTTITELTEDTRELADIVEELVLYVAARDESFAAYRTAKASGTEEDFVLFDTNRRSAAVIEKRVIARLRTLDPELVTRSEINAEAADLARVADLLNGKLVELEARRESLILASSYQIRMEAFLRSTGKDPVPVHLPGYDDLAEGELVRRDRFGLMLQNDELDRFNELAAESRRLADLGNRYRAGQADLAEVFEELADTILADIGALASEIDRLREQFESGEHEAHLDALRESFVAFRQAVADATLEFADEAEASLEEQ